MSWTPTTFKAAFDEFSAISDAKVTLALAEAADTCDERVFGDSYDAAVGLWAAHVLSSSPGGQQSRLASDMADTTYRQRWQQLAQRKAGGAWAIGQTP